MAQGFKTKPGKTAVKAHQARKNKPVPRKMKDYANVAHKNLTASIDRNIESICFDRVA